GQSFIGRVESREMRCGKVRADEKRSLFLHQLELSFSQREAVFDRISASANYIVGGPASINVNCKSAPGVMRLIRCSVNLFFGVEIIAVVRGEFDEVRTVIDVLVDGFANLIRGVGVNILMQPKGAYLFRHALRLAAERADDFSRALQGGHLDPAVASGFLQIVAGVIGFVPDFTHGSETGVEKDLAVV